jgi:geranylgeranyl pyrophosphate synthase
MERQPADNPVKKLFASQDGERAVHLAAALTQIRDSDILDEATGVARDFRDRAAAALDLLPDSADRAALIEIADYVLSRRS